MAAGILETEPGRGVRQTAKDVRELAVYGSLE